MSKNPSSAICESQGCAAPAGETRQADGAAAAWLDSALALWLRGDDAGARADRP